MHNTGITTAGLESKQQDTRIVHHMGYAGISLVQIGDTYHVQAVQSGGPATVFHTTDYNSAKRMYELMIDLTPE